MIICHGDSSAIKYGGSDEIYLILITIFKITNVIINELKDDVTRKVSKYIPYYLLSYFQGIKDVRSIWLISTDAV